MDSSLVEGGLNVTLTIRLLMHGKVSTATWNHFIKVFKRGCNVELLVSYIIHLFFFFLQEVGSIIGKVSCSWC